MTAKSRRLELCPLCHDTRERVLDLEAKTMVVTLPRDCLFRLNCATEMREPFGSLRVDPD